MGYHQISKKKKKITHAQHTKNDKKSENYNENIISIKNKNTFIYYLYFYIKKHTTNSPRHFKKIN